MLEILKFIGQDVKHFLGAMITINLIMYWIGEAIINLICKTILKRNKESEDK